MLTASRPPSLVTCVIVALIALGSFRKSSVAATVTAVEVSWVLGLRVQDIDGFSDSCRARFSEAFLSVMADRLSMLGGRLVSLMQEQKVGLV